MEWEGLLWGIEDGERQQVRGNRPANAEANEDRVCSESCPGEREENRMIFLHASVKCSCRLRES